MTSNTIKFQSFPGNKLSWRNMQGAATDVAPAGRRTFAMILDEDTASMMEEDGWTCIKRKPLNSRDPDSPIVPRLVVRINFNSPNPPKVYVASSDGKRRTEVDGAWLDEQNIDKRRLEWCHISINPYESDVNGNHWKSAYLDTIVFKLQEDAFADLYQDEDVTPF